MSGFNSFEAFLDYENNFIYYFENIENFCLQTGDENNVLERNAQETTHFSV